MGVQILGPKATPTPVPTSEPTAVPTATPEPTPAPTADRGSAVTTTPVPTSEPDTTITPYGYVITKATLGPQNWTNPTPKPAPNALATPALVSPQEGSVFNIFPRKTIYIWQPVANATSYRLEIQYNGGIWSPWGTFVTASTTYTNNFVGAQQGRWRVTALDSTGTHPESAPSEWRTFRYTV
jgi:hypothetical protein